MTNFPYEHRKEVADHEKYHLLFDLTIGSKFISVTCVQDSNNPGAYEGCAKSVVCDGGTAKVTNTVPPDTLNPGMLFSLIAGRAGMELFHPEIDVAGTFLSDFQEVEKLLKPHPDTCEVMKWRCENPTATAEDFYQRFKYKVFAILDQAPARRAMDALHTALMQYGTLSGRTAAQIMQDAWQADGTPLPPHFIPADKHGSLADNGPCNFTDLRLAIHSHVGLLIKYVERLRDTGTRREKAAMNDFWEKLAMLKIITLE